MGYIDYESFQVPDWYWNVILNQYRKRYIKNLVNRLITRNTLVHLN